MDLGLSTAPILYAAQEYPHLRPLVMRRFKEKGDKQTALETLYKSDTAMDKASNLAKYHAQVCFMFYNLLTVVLKVTLSSFISSKHSLLYAISLIFTFVSVTYYLSTLQKAVDALLRLPQSDARDALIRLTHLVITRKK